MPITQELENMQNLESVGFSHKQAEALAKIIEQSHVDSQENLKDFIRNEMTNLDLRMDNKIGKLEINLKSSQADLLIKFSREYEGRILNNQYLIFKT